MGVSALELRRRVLMAQPHKERKTGGIVSFKTHVPQVLDVAVPLSPVQAGTGDPYPPGGGKNKLPNNANTSTVQGVTYTVGIDGSITATGTSTGWTGLAVSTLTLPAGSYVLKSLVPASSRYNYYLVLRNNGEGTTIASTSSASNEQFTLAEQTELTCTLYARPNQALQDVVCYPMILLSTETDLTYAPYSNIRPITGWTGATAYRTGKNLLPQTNYKENRFSVAEDGTISQLDEASATWAWTYTNSIFRTTLPPGTYSVTETLLDNVEAFSHSVKVIAEDNTIIRSIVNGAKPAGEYSQSFTIDKTTNVGIAIKCYSAKAKLSMVAGATASEYAPYSGESFPFTFPETVYVGTLNAVTGVLTVTHAMWTKNTADMDSILEAYPGWLLSGIKDIVGSGLNATLTVLSNIGTKVGVNTRGNNDSLFLKKAIYGKTKEEWVSLAIDVQVVAELADPIVIPLTPAEIRALMGENNVFSDAGDVDVEFWTN